MAAKDYRVSNGLSDVGHRYCNGGASLMTHNYVVTGGTWTGRARNGIDVDQIVTALIARGIRVEDIRVTVLAKEEK